MADEVESQKRALLTAIAQQGAFGREQFAANQQSLEQGRTGAMDASFARSDAIRTPQALNTALGTQAAQPFDAALKDQQVAALAYQQQLGGINALNSNYMSQVQAARPLVSSITDTQIAQIRAQQAKAAAQQAAADKYAEEDRNWTREQREQQRLGWKENQVAAQDAIKEQNALDAGAAVQRRVLSEVQGAPLKQAQKDLFLQVAQSAETESAAIQAVNQSQLKDAEKEALRRYISQYFNYENDPLYRIGTGQGKEAD